jgi:hypothetical protein
LLKILDFNWSSSIFKAQLEQAKKQKQVVQDSIDDDWTESSNLTKSVIHQNKLVKNGQFDPVEYFGCDYMKDYKFYINYPKLEIVFKNHEYLETNKEILKSQNLVTVDTSTMNTTEVYKQEDSNILSQSTQQSKVSTVFNVI